MAETKAEVRQRRGKALTRMIRLHDDHEAFDRDLWATVPPIERLVASFELSLLAAKMKGFRGDQLRLRRSVARLQRRGS